MKCDKIRYTYLLRNFRVVCLLVWFFTSQSTIFQSPQKRLKLLSVLRRWFCWCDLLFIVTPNVRANNCSMFCCTLLYVNSSFAIILMVAWLSLSSLCLGTVVWLFLAVPWICLQFMIVVFPDHTHYFSWVEPVLSSGYSVLPKDTSQWLHSVVPSLMLYRLSHYVPQFEVLTRFISSFSTFRQYFTSCSNFTRNF